VPTGFFRDVARSKARRRLYGNEYALTTMLLGQDEPVVAVDNDNSRNDATVTRDELAEADGLDGAPAYLSIRGRVYDVSAGAAFYGPGKRYHAFVGKDATRAFALGCTAARCISSDTAGLTPAQLKEIDRWTELYETHDKYTYVGRLVDRDDPIDELLRDL